MRIFNKMKKMLLVAAALFCAGNALAEVKTGSYAVVADDIASGAQITSVEGITMTFGTSDTWTSGSGKVTVDGTAFNVYATTGENCSPSNGAIPTAGPYVVFTPQYDGTLTGIVSNAGNNKNGYIVKDEDNNLVNGTVLIDGAEVAWESGTPYNSAAKYNGGVTFEVEAGSTYYFYMGGSKMRFNGFIYTYEEVEAEPEAPATEKVYATFEAPTNTNAVWNAETSSFTWTQSYYNQIRNIGLPTGDISKYEKLVVDCEIVSGTQFRILFYDADGGNLQLYVSQSGVTEFNIVESLKAANDSQKGGGYDYMALIENCFEICLSGAGDAGEVKINSIYLETAPAGAYDLTAYNEAVAAAEEFRAIIEADATMDEEMKAEMYVAIDEAIAYGQEGIDAAASQEDVDLAASSLAETIGFYRSNYDAQMIMVKIDAAQIAGQEALAKYPEETRTDNAGLVIALRNLPMRTLGYTLEELQAAVDAVYAAIPAFELENNQLIVNTAAKKANDYAATLDISEETGTMMQMEAYGTLTYYASEEFLATIDMTSYDAVMAYSQQIDSMLGQFQPMIEAEKAKMASINAATAAVAEAEETLAAYPNGVDNAGMAGALAQVNTILGELNMWDTEYTIADLDAAVVTLKNATKTFAMENTVAIEDGTYYLKNVASGKFMNGANSWGTRASLCEHGVDVVFARQSNGKYTLYTNWGKGYLGSNGFIDSDKAEWILEKQENGNYAISLDFTNYLGYATGSTEVNLALADATSADAQWQLVSRAELEAALANASVENPVDATFYIVGQNFNRADNARNAAWQGGPDLGGDNPNFCAEKYNCTFDVYQDLTGLPNGYYTLSAQGFYRAGGNDVVAANKEQRNAYLYAGAETAPLMSILDDAGKDGMPTDVNIEGYGQVPNSMTTASRAFTAGLYADNSVMVQVTDGTLRIGLKKETTIGADWTIFDNFELTYIGAKSPIEQYVDSLNALIAEAEEWKTTLDAADETENMVIAQIDQMVPAAQAVAEAAESVESVKEMITSVYQFMFGTKAQLAMMAAQNAQMVFASYENPTDEAGFEAAITQVFVVANGLMMGEGAYTMADLDAAVAAMEAAEEAFIKENTVLGDRIYDFSRKAWGGHTTDLTVTQGADVVETIDGVGVSTFSIDGKLVEGFLAQGGQFLKRGGYDGLLAQKGPRTLAVQQVKTGQVVTWYGHKQNSEFTLTLVENGVAAVDETNTVAGSVYTYTIVADGTMAVRMERYAYLDSITIVTPGADLDLAAYEEAVAAAEAFKAVLAADEVTDEMMIEELIVAVDEAIAYAQEGVDAAASQEDVDLATTSLNETIEFYKSNYDKQVAVANAEAVVAEAQTALELYGEEVEGAAEVQAGIDNVNELIATFGRPFGGASAEELNAAVNELKAALAAYIGQGAPSVAYLCGATEANDALYNALVAGGCQVTPLNYDDVVLTKKIVESDFVGKYDLVVLAGATADDSNLAKTFDEFVGMVPVLSIKNAWYRQAMSGGVNGGKPGRADAPSLSLVKAEKYAEHPIFAGIEGNEIAVFNDMQKEDGNYLLTNGEFAYDEPEQVTLATVNNNECIGEAWTDGFGWIIIPADAAALTEGALTADGETLIMNAVKYLIAGEQFIVELPYNIAYLCGATETTEDIYTALVAAGHNVTPLNYDDVTLTEEIVANDFAGKYDVVVLAGATGSSANLAKSANLLVGKVNVLSTKSFWYKHYGTNGDNPGTADAPSRSIVKAAAYAEHPIFAGLAGDEIIVFNDMAKENGRYLQQNGSFANGPAQETLATTNGKACIGEAWLDGFGYMIVPVDGAQPEGYLTEDGKALFVNIVDYLVNGEQYVSGIEGVTVGATQWPADIYDMSGRMVKKGATSLEGLQKGLYFVNGKKYLVK